MYILHFWRIFIPTQRRVIENPKELGAFVAKNIKGKQLKNGLFRGLG